MLDLHIDVAGDTGYARAFDDLDHLLDDMRNPLTQIRDLLILRTRDQFETEGARSGDPWQHLSEAYERWKRQHYPGRQILERTGTLRHLLDSGRATIQLGQHRLVWGVPYASRGPDGAPIDLYAAAHQHGDPDRHLPARPIIQLTGSDARDIDRTVVRWVAQLRRQIGFL